MTTSAPHGEPPPTAPAPRCHALVPCAGSGSRAATALPKQYVALAGEPMVAHTLRALAAVPRLASILVVLAPEDTQFERLLPQFAGLQVWTAHVGGETRAASVAAGLAALLQRGAAVDDWVLVHDAARCLVEPAAVDALIDACIGDAVGGLLARPVADTLKRADDHGRVAATIDRRAMWAAQTPQMFRLGVLQAALEEAGDGVTDEASAIEALGLRPLLVEGPARNFKLTYAADFELAERLLAAPEPDR